jgi:hypothetical protein
MSKIAVFALIALVSTGAQAAENWRFCVAADFDKRRVFISDVFNSGRPRTDLEHWFDHQVAERGTLAQYVQCPVPGDLIAIRRDREHAERFNKEFGFQVIPVN